MNAVIDAIRSRRTIKRMDAERMPSRMDIEAILDAATWAPTHHLTEPWRFVVLEKGARRRLGEALESGLAQTGARPPSEQQLAKEREKPLSAPIVIALIAAPRKEENIVPQEEIVAAGAALQNMLLAAQSLGLATSIRTGSHSYSQAVRKFLEIAPEESLVGLVYVGYSAGAVAPGRRRPAREKVVWWDR